MYIKFIKMENLEIFDSEKFLIINRYKVSYKLSHEILHRKIEIKDVNCFIYIIIKNLIKFSIIIIN